MRANWRVKRDQRVRRRRGYVRVQFIGAGHRADGYVAYLTDHQAREMARQLEGRPKPLLPTSREVYRLMLEGLHGHPDLWLSLLPEGIYSQGLSLAETKRRVRRWRKGALDEAFLIHTPTCKFGGGC